MQDPVYRFIIKGQGINGEGFCLALTLIDHLHRPVNDRECTKAQKIKLDQTSSFDVILVELRHQPATGFFTVQWRKVSQFSRRDDYPAGVRTDITRNPFELEGHVHDFLGVFVAVNEL